MPTLFSDLALESREALLSATPGEIDGVLFEDHHQGSENQDHIDQRLFCSFHHAYAR